MPFSYSFSREDRFPLQAKAFAVAQEILASRDGAGFIFHIETHAGTSYSGPTLSTEPIKIDNEGIISIEHNGSVVFIQNSAIAAIRVEEC